MYKIIKDFFTSNLYWKALSVLMAIVLWFVVMNINNPTEIKTFSLNIDIINEKKLEEKGMVVLNEEELNNQKIEVKIKGTRTTLDVLNKKENKDKIKLILDLEQLSSYNIVDEPLEVIASLKADMPTIAYPNNNFEIVGFYPNTATVYLDKFITIPKKIHSKVVGKVKDGYAYSNAEVSSEYVKVSGAKSIVDKIVSIYAEVDIDGAKQTIEEKVKPVAYDKQGKVVENVKFNTEYVTIKVPVSLQGVLEIAEPSLVGNLQTGYIIDSVYYEPKKIEVIGDNNSLKKITKLILPDIDVTNIKEKTKYQVDIQPILKRLNLRLKNPANSKINVVINIKQIKTNIFNIPPEKIHIEGYTEALNVDILNDINIEVLGSSEELEKLTLDNINCSIDITGLENGEYKLQANVILPNNLKVVSNPIVDVKLSNKDESQITTQTLEITETTETITETTTEIEITETTEIITETTTETEITEKPIS